MKSLKDQLQKAGLAEKKFAGKKNKQPKKPKAARKQSSATSLLVEQQRAAKAAADKELNLQRHLEQEKKAQVSQVKQLIERSKIDRDDGELAYNFTHNNKVKTLYVSTEQQKQLARGQVTIVCLNEAYDLVPRLVAEKIQQRDNSFVIENRQQESTPSEDDPYADYEIPDDLTW